MADTSIDVTNYLRSERVMSFSSLTAGNVACSYVFNKYSLSNNSKVVSTKSHLEPHSGIYRLFMKGTSDVYVL